MITKETLRKSFWALPVHEALDALETTASGLMRDEAEERLRVFGKNVLAKRIRITKLKILVRQFGSPLIFLLLIAGGVTLFLKDFKDAGFILAAALINAILGFYQESKAETALAHLRTYIRERNRVFRDNHEIEVDSSELAPGDVIHLSQGDRIPADCRLIYVNDFAVDQAILTGESLPVSKDIKPASFQAVLADQNSMVFSGTVAVQGFANAVVSATGKYTELGKIAALVARPEKERTPLREAINKFSIKASIILIGLTALIFSLGVLTGSSLLDMFLISVAIVVSAIPEGLPIAMTVILAVGVQRLAWKKGIVRKLLAAETMGSTSVILTDKTGTLTEAKMELSEIKVYKEDRAEERKETILKLAILNSDVVIENPGDSPFDWEIIGRPLEVAIVRSAAKFDILAPDVRKKMKAVDYLPFSSVNKFSANVIQQGSKYLLSVFGAPEILLKFSNLPDNSRRQIHRDVDKVAYGGARVLAVATKELSGIEGVSLRQKEIFKDLDFLGTMSFRDPIRKEVRDAVNRAAQAGVRTLIVTGDHRGTAEFVAKEVGISIDGDSVIDGAELDALNDEDLKNRLPNLRIVSRVSPEGKLRIVKALQGIGEIVAMTGDGVNDAPSLKEADIGVSMGSGTDVAKDVSDLVLLDDNFETIVEAVAEGRRIIQNIRKVIVYLLSNALDGLILIGGSLLIGLSLPLNALQILWVNFFTDSFPAIALAFEKKIDHWVDRPAPIHKGLLDSEMRFLIQVIGALTSVLLLVLYVGLLYLGIEEKLVHTFIFAAFGTYSLFLVFAVRSLRRSIFTYNPFSNPALLGSVILGLGLMAIAIYVPFLQKLFGTMPLPLNWLWGIVGLGILNVFAIEFGKWVFRKKQLTTNN